MLPLCVQAHQRKKQEGDHTSSSLVAITTTKKVKTDLANKKVQKIALPLTYQIYCQVYVFLHSVPLSLKIL